MTEGETMTPTEVAVLIWGPTEDDSRSWGARRVRHLARRMFPQSAPGQGRAWKLNHAQVRLIQQEVQ